MPCHLGIDLKRKTLRLKENQDQNLEMARKHLNVFIVMRKDI